MNGVFEDLIGQPLAVNLLASALASQRLAPAYLFAGPDGVGRRLAALRFLEGMLAETGSSPRQRRRLEERNHPDLLWVEPTFQHQGRLLTRVEAEEAGIGRRTPPLAPGADPRSQSLSGTSARGGQAGHGGDRNGGGHG